SLDYTDAYGFWKYNFNNFVAAARGTFHYGFIPSKRFDLYGGFMLGVHVETYHYTTNYGANDLGNYGGLHPIAGVFIGGTFYIIDPLALFAEYGYDVCFLKVGLTIKP
ncbi:MAG TPA: hypothetical protein VE978_16980, partial [Chitinophagales bacterium]|nr:hypothetical protein [Chitinophagales bacterium]